MSVFLIISQVRVKSMVTDLVDDLVNTNGIWLSAWGSFRFMWVMPYIVEFGNIEFNSCELDPLGLLNKFTSLSKQLEIWNRFYGVDHVSCESFMDVTLAELVTLFLRTALRSSLVTLRRWLEKLINGSPMPCALESLYSLEVSKICVKPILKFFNKICVELLFIYKRYPTLVVSPRRLCTGFL